MNRNNYSAAIWRGNGVDRARWAVFSAASGCWTFPSGYGRRNAERLARQLNNR